MRALLGIFHIIMWVLVALFTRAAYADPTEIFFSASQTKPKTNLLFILDNSGSMASLISNSEKSRMQGMQEALRAVMQQSSDQLNVGIMRFGGDGLNRANGVSFPISLIDAKAAPIVAPYITSDNLPDPDGNITVRNFLPDIADNWVALGLTPIVDSLYEASLYYRGKNTVLGRYPPNQIHAAHPSTYTGSLNSCASYQSIYCLDEGNGCPSDKRDCKDIDSASYCITDTCTGSLDNATYKSPIQYACQTNYMVLMSDGEPTDSLMTDTIKSELFNNQQTCDSLPSNFSSGVCGPEMTRYLAENDVAPQLEGKQTIETFTIGFGLENSLNAQEYLKSLASPDGGFYTADNTEQLTRAFLDIVNKVDKSSLSSSPPSYGLSSSNALAHGDEVYIPVFDRALMPLWSGNLRKFKRKDGILIDKNNRPAVDEKGALLEGAMDFWSDVAAGIDVTLGGAAALLDPKERLLWTDIGDQLVPLTKENNLVSAKLLGLQNNNASDLQVIEKRNTYLDFVRGYDAEGKPRKHMGDILHSKPLVFSYKNKSLVFAATNEGYLHAFDAETGKEKWAFMPSRLLKNVPTFYKNKDYRTHVYGIDGELSFWENDIDRNGEIDASKGEGIYVFFGLGRGGNAYYALNITQPDSPKLAWKINGEAEESSDNNDNGNANNGNGNGNGNAYAYGRNNGAVFGQTEESNPFSELGETWSKPVLGKMYIGDRNKPVLTYVLIFGGGYDPVKDEANRQIRPADRLGKDVFIVNAQTGKLIWSFSRDTKVAGGSSLQHSVAGNIRVLDVDSNGSLDRLYFADTGGNVWRVDMNIDLLDDDESLYNYSDSQATLFATLSDNQPDGDRMFFNAPDVSMIFYKNKPVLLVSIGSGYRMHPLDQKTRNYFVVMRDENVYNPPPRNTKPLVMGEDGIVPTSMLNGKSLLETPYKGWKKELTFSGEKVFTNSLTFMNKIMFNTFSVTDASGNAQDYNDVCNPPANTARSYVLDIFTGQPAVDLNRNGQLADEGDTFVISGSGVVDTPQLVFLDPTAKDGGQCKKGDCQQIIEVRVGTLKLPLIDASNSSNNSITTSIDLSLITPKLYWRNQEE